MECSGGRAGAETPTATCIYKRGLLYGHEIGALGYEDKVVTTSLGRVRE